MNWALLFLRFYVTCSIHVALAAVCFVKITGKMFEITVAKPLQYFVFFGCIASYNFIKFAKITIETKFKDKPALLLVAILSFFSFFIAMYCFFKLYFFSQLLSALVLIIVFFYTFAIYPNKKNGRNLPKLKMYLVTFCWLLVGFFLPITNAEIVLDKEILEAAFQRFLFLFVLLLIFEIVDCKKDAKEIVSIPQQIGSNLTKILGFCLLFFSLILEVLLSTTYVKQLRLEFFLIICSIICLFLGFSNENKARWYVSFWVEAIPIFWWFLWFANV